MFKIPTEGFAFVLAGLNAFLAHSINLNIIIAKFPKEVAQLVN
jgi:hypothetical protein